MTFHLDDTIAAIGTATGNALRGVIRISGPDAIRSVYSLVSQADQSVLQEVTQATVVSLNLQPSADISLPCDAYIWPDSRSYTRQPSVELHTLGNRPLLNETLQALLGENIRLAEPGEFTMRAFLAGRLDLAQAEAVLGIIDSHGEQQLDTALTQLAGGLSSPLNDAREQLLESLALLEAGLDFAEEDIEFVSEQKIREQLTAVTAEVEKMLLQMQQRETSDTLPRVVLMGDPNTGKSSLFNALLESDQAIVSPIQGTTRDYLSAKMEFAGTHFQLVDTAGLEALNAGESISNSAQAMTVQQQHEADLVLYCFESTHLDHAQARLLDLEQQSQETIAIVTKSDLVPNCNPGFRSIPTSVNQHTGLDQLRTEIVYRLQEARLQAGTVVAGTALRCHTSLTDTLTALHEAILAIDNQIGEEIVAGEIRLALAELGKVVGVVYTDDILDVIFSRFCIGK
ncbi:MAG: tRNA uridine-5-carboxymethylaminomethyl(34) synthesis GTPase MnmE [Blastopirellula sp.]|nr:MAG: tRNA uridine-5-carboxymethylaminomethyl(34) synthesis GTPase MnmE [Blastopirellula sp.]